MKYKFLKYLVYDAPLNSFFLYFRQWMLGIHVEAIAK